jgi:imidazolonepropionase-like amidohydrolase
MNGKWILLCAAALPLAAQNLAVRAETLHTAAGEPVPNGVVLIRDGKIERVGPAAQIPIPPGYQTLSAKVVIPGLVDPHTVVGLSGYQNQPQDQDQVERSAPMQPELRAIDAYDPQERLIEWVRGFGTTTMHTGHGPGILVSGQTMIVKTRGATPEAAALNPAAMVAATLGEGARESQPGRSPGSRAKAVAMLRGELIKAKEYKGSPRDLRLEAFAKVVKGEMPLLVTVNRAHDIVAAIRLAKEFGLKLVLDSAAEAPLVLDEIKASGYPVILHATQFRSGGDAENVSFETAAKLQAAGIPYAIQTGFEGYVPKTRVLLWEAAIAAANGLTFRQALEAVTINAARILGIAGRVGSLEPGKDADLALFDGDPFEYTTHCTGVIIDGKVVSTERR